MNVALLALSQLIVLVEVAVLVGEFLEGETLRPVANAGTDTEGRGVKDGHVERVGLHHGALAFLASLLPFHDNLLPFRHQLAIAGRVGQVAVGECHLKIGEAVGRENALCLRRGRQ